MGCRMGIDWGVTVVTMKSNTHLRLPGDLANGGCAGNALQASGKNGLVSYRTAFLRHFWRAYDCKANIQ